MDVIIDDPHVEYSLLGYGQQTVLILLIPLEGKSYLLWSVDFYSLGMLDDM